ncbi:MAG: alkaline phosphatase family protein [Bacteroidia bacterium]|nr:alkaline phosphatase family protein [Bacteroidia bacterium]NNF30146.1 alkaline phosphatase family protein [Flavobacteriaceae bacterium]NNK55490.1 alkaline phosphatase family protein [Flavobacteriaceae bacterium]
MRLPVLFLAILALFSCGNPSEVKQANTPENIFTEDNASNFTLVFASCNHQDRPQPLWQPILDTNPDVFIWGGDNVYADTDDMEKMKADYDKVSANPLYAKLKEQTAITGTWDDHDYGKNDAGVEWEKKDEAKEILLDFLGVSNDDPRRSREGVYFSETFNANGGSIKMISLDTRYFRSPLKKSDDLGRRYDSWGMDHQGTMLGDAQWKWLEEELKDDSADFTLIVTSIQFLSKEHGWEKWFNFPSEVEKMRELLKGAKARNIVLLSGDRHMAEISVDDESGLGYPLIDFTSSGLTHTWPHFSTEGNEYRVSNIIKRLNFGVLFFNFENRTVTFEIRGRNNFIFERFTQQY